MGIIKFLPQESVILAIILVKSAFLLQQLVQHVMQTLIEFCLQDLVYANQDIMMMEGTKLVFNVFKTVFDVLVQTLVNV